MSALMQDPTPGWAAHGGMEVLEPESRFDRLPDVVRGLLDLYPREIVARWLRSWWLGTGEPSTQSIPEQVACLVGADALEAARLRGHAAQTRKSRAKGGRKPTGRPVGAPRLFDAEEIRSLLRLGLSVGYVARKIGCSAMTVYKERMAIGIAVPRDEASAAGLREAREGLARYRALRDEGWTVAAATAEVGADRLTLRRWQSRLHREGDRR